MNWRDQPIGIDADGQTIERCPQAGEPLVVVRVKKSRLAGWWVNGYWCPTAAVRDFSIAKAKELA